MPLFSPDTLIMMNPDTRYEEKMQEKEAQHAALEGVFNDYGYSVTTLPTIVEQFGSRYHTTSLRFSKDWYRA